MASCLELCLGSSVTILGPFARMIAEGKAADVLRACHANPEAGAELIAGYVEQTRSELNAASSGSLTYVLAGAEPAYLTPMEYGGLFLDWDRNLLESVRQLDVILKLDLGADAYVDCLADLPAKVFWWSASTTGVSLRSIRELRDGWLATDDLDADYDIREGKV